MNENLSTAVFMIGFLTAIYLSAFVLLMLAYISGILLVIGFLLLTPPWIWFWRWAKRP